MAINEEPKIFQSRETVEIPRDIMINLFEMKEEEIPALRERIEKNKGLIRIFIHPYFRDYGESQERDRQEGKDYFPDSTNLVEVEEAFKKILRTQSENNPPLFLFIGAASLNEFYKQYQTLIKAKVFVIPTREYSPTPLTPEFYPKNPTKDPFAELDLSEEYKERREKIGWQETIKILKNLGVKKIITGGAEFYVGEKKEGPHFGCLGNAINHFDKDFEIELSGLSWPDSRKKIANLNNEEKTTR